MGPSSMLCPLHIFHSHVSQLTWDTRPPDWSLHPHAVRHRSIPWWPSCICASLSLCSDIGMTMRLLYSSRDWWAVRASLTFQYGVSPWGMWCLSGHSVSQNLSTCAHTASCACASRYSWSRPSVAGRVAATPSICASTSSSNSVTSPICAIGARNSASAVWSWVYTWYMRGQIGSFSTEIGVCKGEGRPGALEVCGLSQWQSVSPEGKLRIGLKPMSEPVPRFRFARIDVQCPIVIVMQRRLVSIPSCSSGAARCPVHGRMRLLKGHVGCDSTSLNCMKAFSWLGPQVHSLLAVRSSLRGWVSSASWGENFPIWFAMPRNRCRSDVLFGLGILKWAAILSGLPGYCLQQPYDPGIWWMSWRIRVEGDSYWLNPLQCRQ